MVNSRTIGGVVLCMALCGVPLTLPSATEGGSHVAVSISTANAAELSVAQTTYLRKPKRFAAVRVSRLYDLYCGGPYVGSGYNGGTFYGGPWIDLHCFGRTY